MLALEPPRPLRCLLPRTLRASARCGSAAHCRVASSTTATALRNSRWRVSLARTSSVRYVRRNSWHSGGLYGCLTLRIYVCVLTTACSCTLVLPVSNLVRRRNRSAACAVRWRITRAVYRRTVRRTSLGNASFAPSTKPAAAVKWQLLP